MLKKVRPGILTLTLLVAPMTLTQVNAADEQISSKQIPSIDPVMNKHYSPLLLPKTAEQRGISLSGDARLREIGRNHYAMDGGKMLIETDSPMRIDTSRCSVFAKAHTVFILFENEDGLRVFNLHDSARNGIRVELKDKIVNLDPGVEAAIVSKSYKIAHPVLIGTKVGFRRPEITPISDKENLAVLEFSIADKLKHGRIFDQLRESPNAQDHELLNRIEKTAAAITTLYKKGTGPHGAYARNRGWINDRSPGREEYTSFRKRAEQEKQLAGKVSIQ